MRRLDPIGHLRTHPRARKILIWCFAAAVVTAGILVALPMAVAWYAQEWLVDNGATSASIDDVDINLFTGAVRISGLQAGGSDRQRLYVGSAELDVRWWPLVSQRVYVESLRLADAQVDLVAGEAGAWQIGALTIRPAGQTAPPEATQIGIASGEESSPWGFGSEVVRLTNVLVTYRDAVFDTEVDVREILVGSQFTWDAGRTTELAVNLSIDGSPLVLSSDVQPWAEERRMSGSVKLSDLKLADFRQTLQTLSGLGESRGTINLNLDLSATYNADGVVELLITGPLEVANAGFTLDNIAVANQNLRWQGEVALQLPAPENGPLLRVEGAVQLAGTRAALADLELDAELGSLSWKGTVLFSPARAPETSPDLTVRSTLAGRDFRLDHARVPYVLTELKEIDATGIQLNGFDQSSVQQLRLQGLSFLGERPEAKQPDILTVEQLEISGFGFDAQGGLTAETLALRGPMASAVRNEQGEFERIDALIAAFADDREVSDGETEDGAEEPPAEASPPLKIAIADALVQAEALLSFEDRAVAPPASFKLSTMDLAIKNFDSSGDTPMNIRLVTGDGNMKLTTDGTLNAFSQTLSAELAVRLTALDLPEIISPYLPGYNIERGRLNTNSTVAIKANAVDVQNALLIERLKLSGKAAEGNAPLAEGMAMPLDVALDLLRDSDDRIELQLPISGSLDELEIGTGDIVRQAMQKALQNAAMSYVKNALQPLGTILLVGKLAAKAARPRFAPVAMAPGDSSLSGTVREYLQKLGTLLIERPSLQLTICGVATPADRQALESMARERMAQDDAAGSPDAVSPRSNDGESEPAPAERAEPADPVVPDLEMLQLAELRTAAVVGYLTDQQNIAPERLFACRATIERSDDEGPRAEISL